SVSTGQLLALARDTIIEATLSAQGFKPLPDAAGEMEKTALDLHLTIGKKNTRLSSALGTQHPGFSSARDRLNITLLQLNTLLETQAARSKGLEGCWQRALTLTGKIEHWQKQESNQDYVGWVESYSQSLQLNTTPISIAETFGKQLES